ncbi:MAG: CotH kinase family protein [Nocardioides sp.]|uniref:CotH kinase family protein n=1 Tax=Nocardioides sp. TaxID=35761 RepID=UPI0039E4B9C4
MRAPLIRLSLTSAVVALGLLASPTGVAAHTEPRPTPVGAGWATPSGTLEASPQVPVLGTRYRVSGRVLHNKGVRPVVLQRKVGSTWAVIDRTVTKQTGAYRFIVLADGPARLRTVALKTTRPLRSAARSTSLRVRPVAQSARLRLPSSAVEGQPMTAQASLSPARLGRPVALQVASGDQWSTVAHGTEDAHGRVTFTLTAPSASVADYRLHAAKVRRTPALDSHTRTLATVASVPRVDITTDNGAEITDGEIYSHGVVEVSPRGSGLAASSTPARLRVRGNSTSWIRMKLSYKIKLDKKASILEMPPSKNWVLLADFYDRSMLRNRTAFELSRRVGLPWTPGAVPVEVWQNGVFQGLYELDEGIAAEPDRVDIDTDDGVAALLEADSWADPGTPSFVTSRGLQVFVKEPDEPSQADVDTIAASIQQFEDVLYSDDYTDAETGYRSYIDVSSFIDWYLVNEITKNVDSSYLNSCWMYLDDSGVLHMGPVWDFDQSSGNRTDSGTDSPVGWFLRANQSVQDPDGTWWGPTMMPGPEGHWINRMFTDPWFVDQVEARWAAVRDSLTSISAYVDAQAALIAPAAARNFAPLAEGGAGMPIGATFLEGPTHVFWGSWSAEASHLSAWLDQRITWMDDQLSTP